MEEILAILRAAAEPTRIRLLSLCAQGDLTVSELVQILGQSQPRVSRHLKVLCDAGLLERLPEGSWVFHRLVRDGKGETLAKLIFALLPDNDSALSLDLERLGKVKEERARAASEFFDANAAKWSQMRSLHVEEEAVEKALSELISKGKNDLGDLLDVGTGPGRMLELFSQSSKTAVGIDMSRDMLAIARANLERDKRTNCTVRQGDMYQLPFGANSFDTVLIHQVLHYADDPARVISEASRVLRPGGRVAIVDFASHQLEDLRSEQRHRRLGFSNVDIFAWSRLVGMEPKEKVELPGTPLTVVIWLAEMPAETPSQTPDWSE
ncbi:MAG: metalloregulator ArsR/SmtB family transcription factor [Alphaproteobacteria bacterium]|nr:metalloregulator ArsR/SmtB family transcription factor [Rhodospirillales bacterium]MCW9044872.1 metalloregulator ArsR/SmtB family transcription factor [Alphaproteobacteria bacterium]